MNDYELIADELRPILDRINQAKEILGMGGLDCAYKANKELETVQDRLCRLIDSLKGQA
jgi:hypothetical protein